MRTLTALLVATLALTMGSATRASDQPDADEPRYVVIVHETNSASSLGRKFVADAFLKKTTRWSSDVAILPVDQKPRSTVRGAFSRAVLKRSVAAVRNYWRQIVFSGRGVPPPELHGDQRVVRYVREHRGAIGYVSARADLVGVKIVRVR